MARKGDAGATRRARGAKPGARRAGRGKPQKKNRADRGELPPVTVLDIADITEDGDGTGVPAEERHNKDVEITVLADRRRGRAFGRGDRVLAKLDRTGPGRYEARVIRKLDRHRSSIFGVVAKGRGGLQLEPADRNARGVFDLEPAGRKTPFKEGDLVEAEIPRSSGYGRKRASVTRNLGPATAPGAYSALAIAEFSIRHVFPEEALAEAGKARKPALGKRADLRDVPLVTIDGADARDFDDAVFAEPLPGGGHRLLVAIADVAHYVAEGGALDAEAALRGNSVYFPDRVVPMLPEALSNGLCSLVPGEDRACLAVEMEIGGDGRKTGHRFLRGLMRSHARLTYDAVEDYHRGGPAPEGVGAGVLDALFAAYECLAGARRERGALKLDLPEKRVRFDDSGTPVAIDRKRQSTSQKLIEEFMILANVSAAETLESADRLCVFRAHEPPAVEKIDALHQLARAMGLSFPKGQAVRPMHFNALLGNAREKGDARDLALLNETVLRSQSQADYRITNPGHFGLALRQYAHFTSPIRRYADLMVHRQLIALIEKRASGPDKAAAAETAGAISLTERQAAAAERRTVDRYAASLMVDRIGRTVEGRVAAVAAFGAFVEIEDSGVEGLLPLARLPRTEYYDTDPLRGVVTGTTTGWKLGIGDVVSVLVEDVSPLKAALTLTYVDGGAADGDGAPGPGGKPGGGAGGAGGKARRGAAKGRNTGKKRPPGKVSKAKTGRKKRRRR